MNRIFTVTIARAGDRCTPRDPTIGAALRELGLGADAGGVRDDVYFVRVPDGTQSATIESFAHDFLAGDPARSATVCAGVQVPPREPSAAIIVARKAGVMDPVEGSILHALRDAGFDPGACQVRTARRYRLVGRGLNRDALDGIARSALANPIVDDVHCFLSGEAERLPDPFRAVHGQPAARVEVGITALDDAALTALGAERGLSLALEELRAIQAHFRAARREPTDVELETLAQTWSEHCCHKTLTGPIEYGKQSIANLLKETIFGVTRDLAAPFCLSVFRDNAGVIAIDDEWALTFKVETHNHPSALEPYGGAGTGVGGVVRDTLGTGLGALPVLSTDVFCFGPLDVDPEHLPSGALHPRRLLTGVVAGVADYGNRLGIPTANGAIFFHPGYAGNPLVFCGSVGLIPRAKVDKKPAAKELIVAIGGRTGRDGIHGATFSSRELTEDSEVESGGAVQIGNPIEEKKVLDALMRARDEGLFTAVTDCGAGGFSSAVGEMGQELGADVELQHAPLKYPGLSAAEIWISEAQERMVLAVPKGKRARLFAILAEEEVEGCVLGEFTGDGILRVRYGGVIVAELSMKFLHDGRPDLKRKARPPQRPREVELDLLGATPGDVLARLLAHPNVASKEPVIRQYDHEVQGRMVLRPLCGARRDAPADACAFDPLRDGRHTVVVGCGMDVHAGECDPYAMGARAVDEAVRNVIAAGGSLARLALLDNFAWGDVNDPEILGALIECARGAAAAARDYRAPFISGKDSLHNTYRAGGVARSIPHTLLISAVSVVPGAPRVPGSDLKRAGSTLMLLGPVEPAIPGSLVQLVYGGAGGAPAPFRGELGARVLALLEAWIAEGAVLACHDVSEGGLAVAAAEMGFGGAGEGIALDLDGIAVGGDGEAPGDIDLLFGEGPHRFLLEVPASRVAALAKTAARKDVPLARLGTVTGDGILSVRRGKRELLRAELVDLRRRWRAPLFEIWPEGAGFSETGAAQ